ncbi:MAG: 3-ketoacyl-ACP reductase [Opitutales bacterium]
MNQSAQEESTPVALITGGTRGIGLACAKALAKEGWSLALNGLRPEREVQGVLSELEAIGAQPIYCRGDISRSEVRDGVLAEIRQRFDRLNLLVNNAGVSVKQRVDLLEATEESWDRVIDINLKAPYFLSQSAAKWLIEQKEADPGFCGAIINMGSVSTVMASTNRGEYCVAKAGLGMATKVFAMHLGEHGIPVYEVRPGVIRTDMTSGVTEKYDERFADGLAVEPRWGEPEDVAKAVAALARGDFPYSSGQVFWVDGGVTVPRL